MGKMQEGGRRGVVRRERWGRCGRREERERCSKEGKERNRERWKGRRRRKVIKGAISRPL